MLLIAIAFFLSELSLYERLADKLAANPKLLDRPASIDDVKWMVGRWKVTARVFRTSRGPERISHGEEVVEPALGGSWLLTRDIYPDGGTDIGYLTYNTVSRRWTSIALDGSGNAVTATGRAWKGNKLVLSAADAEIVGERVNLRQTIEKWSESEYHILNEERLPSGRWVALDEYTYERVSPPSR